MFHIKLRKDKNNYKRYLMHALSLILAISVALPAYIQSSFLEQYIKLESIGIFFIASNLITAISILFFPRLIKKLGNYIVVKGVVVIYTLSLIGLVLANNAFMAVIGLLLFGISSNLFWINIDILLEEASSDKKTGRIRTLHLTAMNLGWVLAPVLSSKFIELGGYSLPYLASAVLALPLLIILISKNKDLKSKTKYHKENINSIFKKMWANRNLKGVFVAATLLNLFFSCAVLYVPIYLNKILGISWTELGWVFAFMLLPFLIFEIPAGYLADKYFGEKEIMLLGLFTIFISLILFFCLTTSNTVIWAAALFLSRIGAALLESMRDTYFFKNVGAKDISVINLFRMTGPLGYLLGAATASICLLILPINYLFLIFAILMVPGFYYIVLIKDSK